MSLKLREYEEKKKSFPVFYFIKIILIITIITYGSYKIYNYYFNNEIKDILSLIEFSKKLNIDKNFKYSKNEDIKNIYLDILNSNDLKNILNKNKFKYRLLKKDNKIIFIVLSDSKNENDKNKIINIINYINNNKNNDNLNILINNFKYNIKCLDNTNCYFSTVLENEKDNEDYIPSSIENTVFDYNLNESSEFIIIK
jgi:hypothetical protein